VSKNIFSGISNDEWENEPCKVEVLDENEETRLAINDNTATEEMVAQLREKVNKHNKGISVLVDENKAESSKKLAEALFDLDEGIVNSNVLERVQKNIQTPKDLLDYAKAVDSISNRIDKQLTRTADKDEAKKGMKGVKIGLAFNNGQIAVAVDGDDYGG